MNFAVKIKDLTLFSNLIYFIGSFCLDCQDLNKATFFFKEGRILNDYVCNNAAVIDFLIALASCA